jgi:hypothetical protein
MKSKQLTKKAAKPAKASLKAGSVEKVKTLGVPANHNETLLRSS